MLSGNLTALKSTEEEMPAKLQKSVARVLDYMRCVCTSEEGAKHVEVGDDSTSTCHYNSPAENHPTVPHVHCTVVLFSLLEADVAVVVVESDGI